MIDGKDWRQLTDTYDISWNELDDIYNSDGYLNTGTTSIGLVEFAGYRWASSREAGSMFSTLTGLTIDGAPPGDTQTEVGSTWMQEMFTLFDTATPAANLEGTWGWTRDPGTVNVSPNGSMCDMVRTVDIDSDRVTTYRSLGGQHEWDFAGAWVYKAEPIPEAATVALLGIGLTGLAGAEIRRRRKKKAVDKI